MKRLKYALTLTCEAGLKLTCEADDPERLLKFLDLKKTDLRPLIASLDQIAVTFEHAPGTSPVTLAGVCPAGKYLVTAGHAADTMPSKPLPDLATDPTEPDDKPEGCQAEGQGGNCGGLGRCDQTGPCAKGGSGA